VRHGGGVAQRCVRGGYPISPGYSPVHSFVVFAPPDDALLAGLATGDPEAATAFIRRYQRRVYGLAYSILGDAVAAEDVAQEAFLRAWRHAPNYDARRASIATWLLTITRNLAVDVLRLRRSQPVDPQILIDLDAAAVGSWSSPGAAVEASDDAARLRRALVQLPVEQRRAIVLAGIGGRTAKEISETEGIPLGTAKTRIRAAMLKLRDLLGAGVEE
jgi:RNA polymerase sigma factor (sigma-70 family)